MMVLNRCALNTLIPLLCKCHESLADALNRRAFLRAVAVSGAKMECQYPENYRQGIEKYQIAQLIRSTAEAQKTDQTK